MIPGGAKRAPRDRCRSAGADVRTDQLDVGTLADQGRVDGHTLTGRDRGVDLNLGLAVDGLGLLPAVEGLHLQAGLGVGLDLGTHVARHGPATLGRDVLPNPQVRLGARCHERPHQLVAALRGLGAPRTRSPGITGWTRVGSGLSQAGRPKDEGRHGNRCGHEHGESALGVVHGSAPFASTRTV